MGGISDTSISQPANQQQKMLQNLIPYQELVSQHFGFIKVLKQNVKPYKYIMVYTQNGIDDAKNLKKLQQKQKWYQCLKENPYIVAIEGVRLTRRAQMCLQKVTLEIYTKYYNYTLALAIDRKLKGNKRFKQGDIFYILQSLLSVWNFFNEMIDSKYFDHFVVENVFITPEGFIKIYPFPLEITSVGSPIRQKKGHKFSTSLLQNQQIIMEMSPKSSQNSSTVGTPVKQRKVLLNEKDNLRDIGIILLQLLLLNKENNDFLSMTPEILAQLLQKLQQKSYITKILKQIMFNLLIRYKEVKVDEMNRLVQFYRNQLDKSISTTLRLEDGPQLIEISQIDKTLHLKKLSEHKNLRAGSISILSKQKSLSRHPSRQ